MLGFDKGRQGTDSHVLSEVRVKSKLAAGQRKFSQGERRGSSGARLSQALKVAFLIVQYNSDCSNSLALGNMRATSETRYDHRNQSATVQDESDLDMVPGLV
jgi:hypothetical protein